MSHTLPRQAAAGCLRLQTDAPDTTHAAWMRRVEHMFDKLNYWSQRSRQRQDLAQLDEHLLKDIAVSQEAAAAEASKWFWM